MSSDAAPHGLEMPIQHLRNLSTARACTEAPTHPAAWHICLTGQRQRLRAAMVSKFEILLVQILKFYAKEFNFRLRALESVAV